VLELRDGFYGLIADGWDITEMDGKGPRGKLPYGSAAEHIVGLLMMERTGGERQTAGTFNAQIEQMTGQPMKNPPNDLQLNAARDRISSLFQTWASTRPGTTLELTFDRGAFAGS
jgi:hypothetical protein